MSRKYDAASVLKQRFARLAPPLLFGTLFLVPPQGWAETVAKDGYRGSVIDWWINEFSLKGLADGIPINHLWFVLYIGAYSLVAVALLTRPIWVARAEGWLARTLTGWKLLVLAQGYNLTNRSYQSYQNRAMPLRHGALSLRVLWH